MCAIARNLIYKEYDRNKQVHFKRCTKYEYNINNYNYFKKLENIIY